MRDLSEVRETMKELSPDNSIDHITDHLPLTSECRSTIAGNEDGCSEDIMSATSSEGESENE